MRLSFGQLVDSISRPTFRLKGKTRLRVAEAPDPFIAPELRSGDEGPVSLATEIIFVEAPAAVGKSTMARALSARSGAALLDLADIPVSTQSLVGLLHSDFSGAGNPVGAFHAGELPIIVDALDEGRLLSGEGSFEQFLETSGELLQESREVTTRPKLIFLGRPDSIDLARVGLELGGAFSSVSVEVDFFSEAAARQLIDAYAMRMAKVNASYRQHPGPVRQLVDAYFEAIRSALGLSPGRLWEADEGRAFAGYAPVLAAVGSLLAELDNFMEVRNQLVARGTLQAWAVIESVLKAILDRERRKLTDQLAKQLSVAVPTQAYDVEEQLTVLSRLIHGQAAVVSGRVPLSGGDLTTYTRMVEQYLPEHPFVRQGEPANAVLGSLILAHAVYHDLLGSVDLLRLGHLSRQPFLWRSLSSLIAERPLLLDGRYVGFALNSLWNDPVREGVEVTIRSSVEESGARVSLAQGAQEAFAFEITLPMSFYGQIRQCSVDVSDDLQILGEAVRNAGSVFFLRGPVDVMCESLTVEADLLTFEGRTWIEALDVRVRPRLSVQVKRGGEVGWSGALVGAHPWSRLPSTVEAPYGSPPADVLEALVDECWRRLPTGATITLARDYTNPGDDRLRWTERLFPESFPKLIELLLAHRLASAESMSASGAAKIRVRFELSWGELRMAVRGQPPDNRYARFIADARSAVG